MGAEAHLAHAGQPIVFGGDRVVNVDADLAAAFRAGRPVDRRSRRPGRCCTCLPSEHAHRVGGRRRRGRGVRGAGSVHRRRRSRASSSASPTGSRMPTHSARSEPPTPPTSRRAAGRGRSTTRLELTPEMLAGMVDGSARVGSAASSVATARRRRSSTAAGASRPGVRRSASSGSCSRVGRTCSPTPSGCCAPATRSSSASARTRSARRGRSSPMRSTRRCRAPVCRQVRCVWSSRRLTPRAGRCSPTGACRWRWRVGRGRQSRSSGPWRDRPEYP